MRLLFILFPLLLILFGAFGLCSVDAEGSKVYVVRIQSVITPVVSEFVAKSVQKAVAMRAEALVIELDTPGGLDTAMRSIIKDIQASSVPVVVYVSPSGARAASAGAFITLAAHVAAMSPGSNIGAAHPVAVGEKLDKVMSEKAANDAAAYIRSIAEQRGRNAQWAEDAVRKSASATETEALKLGIIDLVAKDLAELLARIDGKSVKLASGDRILKTAQAELVRDEMGFRFRLLSFISDPSVAYMLMLIGFYGIFFELSNPGSIVPGVVGAISLVLAFYAFQTLPVNYAGLLLIFIGIVLFLLEVKITSYGLLSLAGLGCLVLGSFMLFDSEVPELRLSLSVILPAALVSAGFFFVTFRLAYRAQKSKVTTGSEGLIGNEGIARTNVTADDGTVLVHGELWMASSKDPIPAGSRVVVLSVSGLRMKVKQASSNR